MVRGRTILARVVKRFGRDRPVPGTPRIFRCVAALWFALGIAPGGWADGASAAPPALAEVARPATSIPGGQPEAQVLTWLLNDFPPFIVLDRDLPGGGVVDAALAYLIAHMPEYEHRIEVSSVARALGLMEQGEPLCHPALLPSEERQRVAVLSDTVHFVLAHHVIVPRDRLARIAPHLDGDGQVNVDSLLADRWLRTSITDKRTFAPLIEQALARHAGEGHVHRTGGQFVATFHQLAAGWIDYLFAYPIEPGWYRAQGQMPEALDLIHLPIAGVGPYTLGHVACTRGAWGQAVVDRVSAVVRAAGERPPWIDVQIAVSDADGARRLEQVFEQHNPFRR